MVCEFLVGRGHESIKDPSQPDFRILNAVVWYEQWAWFFASWDRLTEYYKWFESF